MNTNQRVAKIPDGWTLGTTHDGKQVYWRFTGRGIVAVDPHLFPAYLSLMAREKFTRERRQREDRELHGN